MTTAAKGVERGVKRERALPPATASKIQLPSTFKRYERKDKENVPQSNAPLTELTQGGKSPDSTPCKPGTTEPKTGTIKKLRTHDMCTPSRPLKRNLVKEKSVELFSSVEASITATLEKKITAGQFEYTARVKQQTAILKDLRDSLVLLQQKKGLFVDACTALEEKFDYEMETFRKSVAVALNGKEALSAELQSSMTENVEMKKEVVSLQVKLQNLTEQLTELSGKNAQLTTSTRGLETQIRQQKQEIEDLKKSNEFKADQLEKVREQLESVKHQMAEAQVTARAALAQTERSMGVQLESMKEKLFEANRNLEAAAKEKAALDEKVAKFEVSLVTHKSEALRAQEQTAHSEKACDAYRQQVHSLQEQLTSRSAEVTAALAGFAKTQQFNEGRHEALSQELKEQREKVESLQEVKSKLEGDFRIVTSNLQDTTRQLQEASSKLENTTQELATERQAFEEARAAWRQAEIRVSAEQKSTQETWQVQMAKLNEANQTLTKERDEIRVRAETSGQELLTYQANAGVSQSEQLHNLCKTQMENQLLRQQLEGKDNLAASLVQREEQIKELRERLFCGESTRRELHNKIQELRGNIRVIVRVRPFLPNDEEQGPCVVEFNPNGQALAIASEGNTHKFSFDQVFPTESTQQNIFDEVSNLVQSALDGFNVCLFSYGQTGSGKTHTMQGSVRGQHRGIIPRAIEKVMEEAARLGGQGWEYVLEGTVVEIYLEQLRDLLCDSRSSTNLDIKLDPDNLESVHVPGLARMKITEASQIDALMQLADKHRAVAGTDMNLRSSRSHAVFTLHIVGTNKQKGVVLEGSLNLCDLAGSERLSKSGATGDRLKETQAINKSLSCLSDVFQALQGKASHIPYRNSKLTYLLSPCFSGQGKTLMFVNLSPLPSSHDESLCSLRFASKVAACELGNKQSKNVKRLAPGSTPVPAAPAASAVSAPAPARKSATLATSVAGSRTRPPMR